MHRQRLLPAMKQLTALAVAAGMTFSCLSLTACGGSNSSDDEMLMRTKDAVDAELEALLAGTQGDADLAAELPLAGPEMDEVLGRLAAQSDVIDVLTFDGEGVVQAVKPDRYRNLIATSIISQEQTDLLRDRYEPLLSNVFTAVEGKQAITLQYPIHQAGAYAGTLSLLINHQALFDRASQSTLAGSKYKMTLQQLDGVVLWDSDPSQIGRNVLSDPEFENYPDLQRLVREVIASEEGSGHYLFRSSDSAEAVRKDCTWTTVRHAGAEWRLALFWQE